MFGRKKVRTKKETWKRRIILSFKLIKWMVIILPFVVIFGWWYVNHLGDWVDAQFSTSHKWDLPSRIYSDVDYLYPGVNVTSRRLEEKVSRLGYRRIEGEIKTAGDVTIKPNAIDIFLHDFTYPHEEFKGFPVRINISNGVITSMVHLTAHESIPTIKLEPELIASIFDSKMEDRTLVSIKEVPQHLMEAIIMIEDNRFFVHHGVDPIGIARAMTKNLMSFRVVQGGSTLTQQLVKNYFLDSGRNFTRKIKEALIALALEKRHTKGEILEAYLNEIYLGQRGSSSVSGVGEAAKLYFAKNVDQLTLGEQALLAGMIRSPSRYNPFTNKQAAMERRNFVLATLLESELITDTEYKGAIDDKIVVPDRQMVTNRAPYFIDFVKQQLVEWYSEQILTSQGLNIFTTLDMTSQIIGQEAVEKGLNDLEAKYASRLPKDHNGQLQGAMISIQPQTGYIRALVGGRDYAASQFNRITQAKRQPGSTFKPFVYLTAFDSSRSAISANPSMIIDDTTFTDESGPEPWTPSNYDKKEHGAVSLRTALKHSYNIATAKLAIDVGLESIVKTGQDAGIQSPLKPVPSLALGAFEVTPLEMALAYSIFPNNGLLAVPISIINVTLPNEKILEKKSISMKRVFPEGPVYLTTSILKDVLDSGTAASSRALGFKGIGAGKTGTTSNYRDAWFIGFTPDLLALTWVGYDDNATMNLSGGSAALPIWAHFMTHAVEANTIDFSTPSNIVFVKVDPLSGKIPAKACPSTSYEPFVEGEEPSEPCPLH